jgi:hypothetical protein
MAKIKGQEIGAEYHDPDPTEVDANAPVTQSGVESAIREHP